MIDDDEVNNYYDGDNVSAVQSSIIKKLVYTVSKNI